MRKKFFIKHKQYSIQIPTEFCCAGHYILHQNANNIKIKEIKSKIISTKQSTTNLNSNNQKTKNFINKIIKSTKSNQSLKIKTKINNFQKDLKINNKFNLIKCKFVDIFVKKFYKFEGNCIKIPSLFGFYYQ